MKETLKDKTSLNLHYDKAIRCRRILILSIVLTVFVTTGFGVGNMLLWTIIAFMLGAVAIVACSAKLNTYYDAIDKWCKSVSDGTGYKRIEVTVTNLSDGSTPKVGFYVSRSNDFKIDTSTVFPRAGTPATKHAAEWVAQWQAVAPEQVHYRDGRIIADIRVIDLADTDLPRWAQLNQIVKAARKEVVDGMNRDGVTDKEKMLKNLKTYAASNDEEVRS